MHLPTDPPEKGRRPVVVVSTDARNTNPKADTVLVVPFSTSILKDMPTHVYLAPGESGLEMSVLAAEDISVVRKESLHEPHSRLRNLSHRRICELADKVKMAMGCIDKL